MEDNTNNSILLSIRHLIGMIEDDKVFDQDLIININSAFSTLHQLGVGPTEGFSISDDKTEWKDFINDSKLIEYAKTYVYLYVKIIFDPPLNSAVLESYKERMKELEWRLNVTIESDK